MVISTKIIMFTSNIIVLWLCKKVGFVKQKKCIKRVSLANPGRFLKTDDFACNNIFIANNVSTISKNLIVLNI